MNNFEEDFDDDDFFSGVFPDIPTEAEQRQEEAVMQLAKEGKLSSITGGNSDSRKRGREAVDDLNLFSSVAGEGTDENDQSKEGYSFPVNLSEAPPFITEKLMAFFLPNVPTNSKPVVVNVIAHANLHCGIDLREVSCAIRTAEYLPEKRIPIATLRLQQPDAVLIVRSSGALTIIGAHSLSEARQAAELGARILRKALNLSFSSFQFRVRSITARFNVCSPVRLDALAQHKFEPDESAGGVSRVLCHYEPDQFNGCTIRMVGSTSTSTASPPSGRKEGRKEGLNLSSDPSSTQDSSHPELPSSIPRRNQWCVSCVVFVTGKLTFLGARSPEELEFAFHAVIPIIALYLGGGGQRSTSETQLEGGSTLRTGDETGETIVLGSTALKKEITCRPPPPKEQVRSVVQQLREKWLEYRKEYQNTEDAFEQYETRDSGAPQYLPDGMVREVHDDDVGDFDDFEDLEDNLDDVMDDDGDDY